MNSGVLRTAKLLAAMALGFAFPAAHVYACCIPYAMMVMLWLAFLDMRPAGFRRQHLYLLVANWAVGLAAWAILLPFNRQLAIAALLIGLTPTATASAVVTGMLGGRVEFVAGSVLLTNVVAGLLFPVALPLLLGSHFAMQTAPFLKQTAYIVVAPLLLAQTIRVGAPAWTRSLLRFRHFSFYLWLVALFLVTANASHFLRVQWHAGGGILQIAQIALLAWILCIVNFVLGWKLGGEAFARETSQSLGQKNTLFTIWISLTYVNPLVALGPTFYVLCHNSYNAWQLARQTPPKSLRQPNPKTL
ncbi:MAG: hypothetical protein NTZ46_03900 [Verrucomicrobia bacterium]|nr:hypothetical protein [Verrucomicrobiota bacterium]